MGRQNLNKEIHTSDIKIEQKGAIVDEVLDRTDLVRADEDVVRRIADDLAFNQQPVTIRITKAAEKNAPDSYFCAVNGHNPEYLKDGKWRTLPVPYVPVNTVITLKRMYVEVLARAKVDTITTEHDQIGQNQSEYIRNRIDRNTSSVAAMSIIKDADPRGQPWIEEILRRNF